MTDLGSAILLPRLIAYAAVHAPGIRFEVEQLHLPGAVGKLREGALDGFFCTPVLDEPGLRRDVLFEQRYAGICADSHPRIGETPTVGEILAEGHISIGQESGHQFIDDLLDRAAGGRAREIRATVPNFLLLPYLLEGTDLLGFAPQGVARGAWSRNGRCGCLRCPSSLR